MNHIFGFDGGFTRICSKIFDVLVLGLLWFACSIPVITIGASTTSLYYAMTKGVKRDEGYPVQLFFKSFKQNFKQATILWIIYAALMFICQLNCGIIMARMSGVFAGAMIVFYIAVHVYIVIMCVYSFGALARFDMPTGWFIKLSLYMTIRNFLTSIAIILSVLACLGLVWKVPLFVFAITGPIMFLITEFTERALDRHKE